MDNHVVFLELPKTRVYLRPAEKGDLPFFRQTLNKESIAKFLTHHNPVLEAEEDQWFENLLKHKENTRHCSIVLKDNNELIGSIGLQNINWVNRTASTGTFIGREDLLGQGLGTEAKMLWLKYAFLTLNLRLICSGVYGFNGRSMGYAKKCGYREVGRHPKFVFRNGEYHDLVHFMVTIEEWLPLWEEFEAKMK